MKIKPRADNFKLFLFDIISNSVVLGILAGKGL